MGRAGATSQLPRLVAPPHGRGRRERAGRQGLHSHEPYAAQQSREHVCPAAQGCRCCSLHLWSRSCACATAPMCVEDAVPRTSVCPCVSMPSLSCPFFVSCPFVVRRAPSSLSLTQTRARAGSVSLSLALCLSPLSPSLPPSLLPSFPPSPSSFLSLTRCAWTCLSMCALMTWWAFRTLTLGPFLYCNLLQPIATSDVNNQGGDNRGDREGALPQRAAASPYAHR
jgi:hypothetical protein